MKMTTKFMLSACTACLIASPALAQSSAPQSDENRNTPSINLDAVIVSAGEPRIAIETPVSVSVMDQDSIDAVQATTIGELVQNMPGVNMSGGVSALGLGFNIRGVGTSVGDPASDIIVRIDGAEKFFEAYRQGSTFAEPDLYKRVEVLKGPAAATLVGNGAIGGVVSFTTKDPSDFLKDGDKAALRVKGQYDSSSDGTAFSFIGAKTLADNLGILAAVTIRDAGDYKNGRGDTILPSGVTSRSYLVKGVYNFNGDEDNTLRVSYNKWKSDSTSFYDQQAAAFPNLVHRNVTDDTFIVAYENGFSENPLLDFEAQISYALSDVEQSENTFAATSLGLESEYTYKSWQGRLQNTSELTSGELWTTYLTYGIQGDIQERRNPRIKPDGSLQNGTTSHPDGDTNKFGLYAQAEILYSDKLTIIPGIRYDSSKFEPGDDVPTLETSTVSGFSPKISALYNLTDTFGIFGSYTHAIRLPVLDEVFSYTGSSPVNLNLDPEESDNMEFGATFSLNNSLRDQDAFRAKITYFKNDISNQITRGSAGSFGFINVGEAEYHGVEIEAEYASGGFFSRAAFSTTHGKNAITDTFLNTIPADELDLTVGYAFPSTNFSVGATAEIAFDQNDVSNASQATGGYTVFDAFLTWRPDTVFEGLEIRAGIDNLTDKTYRRHLSNLDAKGRTFKLSLAKTF
ncbi:MAG: TonB-dependent receptor [Robiginitomaculum sp.]|nr:MAG: TonB-dependent receptor [Robiginitomaculum sp.]